MFEFNRNEDRQKQTQNKNKFDWTFLKVYIQMLKLTEIYIARSGYCAQTDAQAWPPISGET